MVLIKKKIYIRRCHRCEDIFKTMFKRSKTCYKCFAPNTRCIQRYAKILKQLEQLNTPKKTRVIKNEKRKPKSNAD